VKFKVVPGRAAPIEKWRDREPADAGKDQETDEWAVVQRINLYGMGLSRQIGSLPAPAASSNSIASGNEKQES
jgi:hypothetical protein